VLYVATVHYQSARWIEIQTRHLRENVTGPLEIWSSLEGIDPAYAVHFDRILEQRGSHAGKLNHLAWEICREAHGDDVLMFLDGDAFPFADPRPLIDDALARAALVAVRRAENVDEPQPHPCFCATTVATWRSLPGDWTAGPTWPGARGQPTTDVGANLLRRLERTGTPWVEVLRSNRRNVDPLYFAVYGDTIYHHGAGFRTGELSPVDRDHPPRRVTLGGARALAPLAAVVNGLRWKAWERSLARRHVRQSNEIYERIARGGREWLSEFM
jgi:hypothetical protein